MAIRVMVVDDTDHVREMLRQMMELDGFEVVAAASSGTDAEEMVRRHRPDVVIMDYKMPGIDGLATTQAIRRSSAIPIILYTAYLDATIEQQARRAGVTVCIGKVEGIDSLEREISALCLDLAHD